MCMPSLFDPPQRMAEPIPSLPPSFPPSKISSSSGTSIAITPSGTQEILATPVGRKYLTGSSRLTSSSSMTLIYPLFSIAPLAVALTLTFPLLSSLWLLLAPGRCYRTWILTTYQFFYLFLPLRSFSPTSVPLLSIFGKLAGMGLPLTLTLTVLQQRNTRLFLFPLLLLSLPLWPRMRSNLPFLSATSNTILNPSSLLRWKKRLVKDARLSLPLTEVIKIARLTSSLPDAPRQSSPRPRLRHGRRLALLSHLSLTLNLYTLFFALSLALLPRLPPLLTSPTNGFIKPRPGSPTILSTIDFSKAFDSVWHPALFHKLISAGLPPCFALWTHAFLSDRRAFVVYQNHKSRSFQVRRGVPQGSVLGPVLFSLFINDLPASLPSSVSCSLYADDLAIWSSSSSPWSLLRWRPHKELCFNWSTGLSTGVFLSIQANVRSPSSQGIPAKLISNPTFSYLAPASVSIQLQLFLGSPSTALFPFLSMYLR